MAQVTGGMSFRQAAVDFGTATATLTSADSAGTAVAVTGGARETGEAHTFDGDFPIVGAGKVAGLDVAVRFIYTESTSETFEKARAVYEAEGGPCFLRFSPASDATSASFRYSAANAAGTEAAGIMTEFLYPSGEADGGAIIPGSFTVHVARLLKGNVVV